MRSYLLRRYNISDPDYKLIETVIIESRPHKAGPQWKFSGAFYFSVVVVAVIGNRSILFIIQVYDNSSGWWLLMNSILIGD